MDKADFGWTSISKDSDGESDLEADPQNDATKDDAAKAGTSPTFLGWTHGFIKNLIIPIDSTPPKSGISDAAYIPEMTAGWFSLLTFSWMSNIMALGYARPLEASDLWKLQDHRSSGVIAEAILSSFDARRKNANEYNARLANGEIKPPFSLRVMSLLRGDGEERLKRWREKDGRVQASLALAMNDAIKWWFWSGGVLKVIGDIAQVTSPLILKSLIIFTTDSYVAHREGTQPLGIEKGIVLVIALVTLQLFGSLCLQHFFYRATSTGVLLRGGLITAIYSRSLRLTTRARATLPNGRLLYYISADVSRVDLCCGFFHIFWTAPIQMAISLALLMSNLGPSALAGFSVFFILTPILGMVMKSLRVIRQKTMVWTDKRAKLLQELLGGIKSIKFFAWETPFLDRIGEYRKREMSHVRSMLLIRAASIAVAVSMPAIASIVAFLLYTGTGHHLTPSVVFSSLTWFQLLRLPLMTLPLSLSSIVDARNAIGRLQECFTAELISDEFQKDPELKYALKVEKASFTWDGPRPDGGKVQKGKRFRLKQIDFKVPRGQLLAIVGAVGSGKTSLLQALIGDMRKTEGSVRLGGSVAYCSQSAWIQNATIRENICFGRPFEAERYRKAVRDVCLDADLNALLKGDMTEVGEKGITLSGCQRQRVNICRAVYSGSDILIFDDPLSALDPHVAETVFNNVLLDSTSGATRILVTHALHFLPKVDYIYFMANGRIAERGTFEGMVANRGKFERSFHESVAKSQEVPVGKKEVDLEDSNSDEDEKKQQVTTRGAVLMQAEERNTGAASLQTCKSYFQSGNGAVLLPAMFVTLLLMQMSGVLSSYWLVWWLERQFTRPKGFYMGIYALLGMAQACTTFLNGVTIAFFIYSASRRLHHDAISRVMYSPMSFFETTPLSRIVDRFSKDIDTIDNVLADSFGTFLTLSSSTIGAFILISIILPPFIIVVAMVFVLYAIATAYYRASARETKRLDAILRSSLYSHFSESLSELATIRAYREEGRFLKENQDRVDIENRAYWLSVANQRWLGLRLDFLGILLILSVSLLTVATRFTVSPARNGVALSWILSIQLAFGLMVRQLAEVENNMNSVGRIVSYAHDLDQEPSRETPERKPDALRPITGELVIKDAFLKHRPELPPVLKGLSMTVKGGEKIGIIGRTGAGKSSIMLALSRIVELVSGSISIDGVDISKIGLDDVRSAVSIIPQEATLYSGTLRFNLDPLGLHDDARLWDALKRSYLSEDTRRMSYASTDEKCGIDDDEDRRRTWSTTTTTMTTTPDDPPFTLDSQIEVGGSNLSAGQCYLVSLARALLKDNKILILDEATASVDHETDRKIQDTIMTEFHDRTILCIAHRLRTVMSYDRICVMDNGNIAEFDDPETLHAQNGIFRAMCDHSNITLDDIRLARIVRSFRDELMVL